MAGQAQRQYELVGQMRVDWGITGMKGQKRVYRIVCDALGWVALPAVAGEARANTSGVLGQIHTHVPGPTDDGLSRWVAACRPTAATGCKPGWPGGQSPGC